MTILQYIFDIIRYRRNREISGMACEYILQNKKQIVAKFAGNVPPIPKKDLALAIFMAGSPGAGKTEFSKNLIASFSPDLRKKVVRIDADEIRELLPEEIYNGKNAHVVQKAASKGVDKLFDHVIDKNKHFILDGTFASYEKANRNIGRAVKHDREVEIWYIFQEPSIAWEFTKKREALEGRRISKKEFIQAFFAAQENVNKIKELFGDKIKIHLAIKNYDNIGLEKLELNAQKVDPYLKKKYNTTSIENLLK